jgi:hypothetical protein
MALLKNEILSADIYNTLPNIRDVMDVPEANSADIADLKQLLTKHNLSDKVRIKLVHIHFLLKEGEVFTARDIDIPKHGSINIMQPLLASQHPLLYGYHYFVDANGNLSAYEYMEAPGPDLSGQQAFIDEFCRLVQDRGLQRKLGLSLRHAEDDESTNELEYPAKRTCVDVPLRIPLPYNEHSHNTMTEFLRDWPKNAEGLELVEESGTIRERQTKSHRHHKHCSHTDQNEGLSDGDTISDAGSSDLEATDGLNVSNRLPRDIDLAGTKLDQSSELYEVVAWIADEVSM